MSPVAVAHCALRPVRRLLQESAMHREIMLFGLGASRPLAEAIAAGLGQSLAMLEEREFEDGEHKARPLESVRDADVYVVHSLYADERHSAEDKLCRLLFFLATVRDHGAARVTAIAPYLCYGRKDRRTQPHDPLGMRYVAQLFEAVGVDRVLTLEVHNPAAFANAFRCRAESLEAHALFAARLVPELHSDEVVVLSPDTGGFKRAEAFRQHLADMLDRPVRLGLMEKWRNGGVVSGRTLFAKVIGCDVVIVDDMIGTGTTMLRAAHAARDAGARSVRAVASHGLFTGGATVALNDPALARLLVSDSVPPFRLRGSGVLDRLDVLPIAPLFVRAIRGT
jgi:ribose-phosphate pyrophosphokinase